MTTTEPSSQVLSLVSAFLSEHGFETTSKALRKELKRKKYTTDLETSEDSVGLQSIVEIWQKTQTSTSEDESQAEKDSTTSESGSDSSSESSGEAAASETSPESESDSGSESESGNKITTTKPSKSKQVKVNKRGVSPATSSSSSSDSDADDENEDTPKAKSVRKKSPSVAKPTRPTNKLKRKAEPSSSEASSSEGESSEDERAAKRAKVAADSETSSSEDSSSDSEVKLGGVDASSEEEHGKLDTSSSEDKEDDTVTSSSDDEQDKDEKVAKPMQPRSLAKLMSAAAEAPSDSSSNTVMGEVVDREEDSAEVEEAQPADNKHPVARKKHVGARPTPLAQLSSHATADSHISNAYRSYDYADRAYNDLSVTRGKGFTKEKNKKKRGSYRGGAIDTSGGKSFKFDD